MTKNKAIIYGGGTVFHVRPHLALSAPAYGSTARELDALLRGDWDTDVRLTRMAGGIDLETNDDIQRDVELAIKDPKVKLIIMSAALCDFVGSPFKGTSVEPAGKDLPRLKSDTFPSIECRPAPKIIELIRKERKDIFLVGFKTTTNESYDDMINSGLRLLKKASCNLVFVNDIHKRVNAVLTPEMAVYGLSKDRDSALKTLVEIINYRTRLTFERTKVGRKRFKEWIEIPRPLREVVGFCVDERAYKPFDGVTVGHFGYRESENVIWSSRRKRNYTSCSNERDLVCVEFSEDGVQAFGAKPSAGVRSQKELLDDEYDCIVHFHCPLRENHLDPITIRNQKPFECGSLECGQNTKAGLKEVRPGIKAVMLDKHGPNIVFNRNIDPQRVISFIEDNFDLSRQAGL